MTYDLEKIEEVCRAATPGPWIIKQEEIVGSCIVDANDDYAIEMDIPENDNLVIIARTALPELCARVRELEGENAGLRADNAQLRTDRTTMLNIYSDMIGYTGRTAPHQAIVDIRHRTSTPHPGAALLKELEGLRKVAEAALKLNIVDDKCSQGERCKGFPEYCSECELTKFKQALTAAQRPTNCEPGEGGGE